VALVAAVAALFVPTVVSQVSDFVDAIPAYVRDLTQGRGRLGFLETKYHVVERVQDAINNRQGGGLLGSGAGTLISVTKGIITGVVATVTIIFMTLFMLLEGPAWMERFHALAPSEQQQRWRDVTRDIYRSVGGYVTGNLLISVIAGTASTIVLLILGVPFAVALGLLVAILDLIPLAGATLAAIIVTLVGLSHSLTAAIVLAIFFVVYQQVENHLLQPLVYGRTVKLSPLAVLISVLIGAEVAGVLGALAAIPVAGTFQILLVDWQRERQRRARSAVLAPDDANAVGPPKPGVTAPAS
jgi:predicted PurR-regulated permease PerM